VLSARAKLKAGEITTTAFIEQKIDTSSQSDELNRVNTDRKEGVIVIELSGNYGFQS